MKVIPHMHDFICELPAAAREEFCELSMIREIKGGCTLYRQGDSSDSIYQLVDGKVKLCNYTQDGKESTAGEFQPGDCFGEMGFIDGMPRISHAVATETSHIRVMNKEAFEKWCVSHPEVYQSLTLMLCRRVRYLYTLREEASELTLNQRVALTILRMSLSRASDHGSREMYIAMSQEELGRILGVSRQSINKELKALANQGFIQLRYGRIYIEDMQRLTVHHEHLLSTEPITPGY